MNSSAIAKNSQSDTRSVLSKSSRRIKRVTPEGSNTPLTPKRGMQKIAKGFSKASLNSETVEASRYTGAQVAGLKDLEKSGALTAGVTKDAVTGKVQDTGLGLSALEELIAEKKRARLEEIELKLELEAQSDPMTVSKHGLLCKLRGGHTLAVTGCTYSDDGKYVTSCSLDGSVVTFDVKHQKVKRTYEGHVGMVFSCEYIPLPGCKVLATTGQDSTIRLWDRKSGKCKFVFKDEHQFSVYTAAWSPDGQRLATAGEDRNIVIWDVKTAIECAEDPSLKNDAIIDYKMFGHPQNLHGHRGPIRKMIFSKDGKLLVSGSDDGKIKCWKLGASGGGVVSVSIDAHAGGVLDMDVCPDGTKFVSCSRDGTIKQWYMRSGLQISTLIGHAGCVYCVKYTPEKPIDSTGPAKGRRIISGGHDMAAIVWDATSGALLQRMSAIHRSYILSVSVKPDGREFVTASGDHTVGVWRAIAPTRWDLFVEKAQALASDAMRVALEAIGLAEYFTTQQRESQAAAATRR
jgi:WD40 repeat protein